MLPAHLVREIDGGSDQPAAQATGVSPFQSASAMGQPLHEQAVGQPLREASDKVSPFKTSVPGEIMDKCPVEMRAALERHLFKGGLLPVQLQLLKDAAQEGKQDAKAFLEVAAQAKAYLEVPILPKVTGNGGDPCTAEEPKVHWSRVAKGEVEQAQL